MFQLLTAPEVQPTQAHRYMVELASNDIDFEGVPVAFKTLDVVVTEPTLDAISVLLQSSGHLNGWGLVDHWIPQDCDCF